MDNRRRMMLAGGKKVDPLSVFAYGNTKLTNGTISGKGYYFESGVIKITQWYDSTWSEYSNGYINIKGVDFTEYKTLKIECRYNSTAAASNHYVGYGTSTNSYISSYTAYQYCSSAFAVKSFDISALSGTSYYIKATPYTTGTGYIEIKNIWLE